MEFLKESVDYAIFGILGLMGFIALWFSIERVLFFSKVNLQDYPTQEAFEDAITKNLTTLYIIYSNAPYVGLLGTVVGIMITFYDMGLSGSIDTKGIMTGLSLALKATALGLAVAIPTLIAYNGLYRKITLLSNRYKQEVKND
ncbi:TonB-system energizer ExbB [Helicobacter burdigaliensis]|uniref:TonB-system energizer ExbB n=1 Tax=Helicobacter burdigaliensis TaxID=2315334 RepID=UPI000EF6A6A2|nr:TonB-system energizer ExbB [Helicobacter burdigaliensis]